MLFYTTALHIWEVLRGLKSACVFICLYLQLEVQSDCEWSYSNAAFVQQHLCHHPATYSERICHPGSDTSNSVQPKTSDGFFLVNFPQTQLEKWHLERNEAEFLLKHRVPHLAEGIWVTSSSCVPLSDWYTEALYFEEDQCQYQPGVGPRRK